jgi:hypothetical protein
MISKIYMNNKKCTQKSFTPETILPYKNLPKTLKNLGFSAKLFLGALLQRSTSGDRTSG